MLMPQKQRFRQPHACHAGMPSRIRVALPKPKVRDNGLDLVLVQQTLRDSTGLCFGIAYLSRSGYDRSTFMKVLLR